MGILEDKSFVPRITIFDNIVRSDAHRPRHVADTCACWNPEAINKARKVLKSNVRMVCEDATAYAAVLSLSIEMLNHGKTVKAEIIKGWEIK